MKEKPWDLEPDFAKWIDRETGLVCAIVRNPIAGSLCGYVRVSNKMAKKLRQYSRAVAPVVRFGRTHYRPGHSRHGINNLGVHGGVTFSGQHWHKKMLQGYWVGFDCGHYNDLMPKMLDTLPDSIAQYGVYRDFSYVKSECVSLARQLKEVK